MCWYSKSRHQLGRRIGPRLSSAKPSKIALVPFVTPWAMSMFRITTTRSPSLLSLAWGRHGATGASIGDEGLLDIRGLILPSHLWGLCVAVGFPVAPAWEQAFACGPYCPRKRAMFTANFARLPSSTRHLYKGTENALGDEKVRLRNTEGERENSPSLVVNVPTQVPLCLKEASWLSLCFGRASPK